MLIGGSFSNVAAASLSEKWSQTDKKAKGYVAAIMCFLGAIFAFAVFFGQSFLMSIIFYAIYFTLSDGFLAPVLSMLATAAPV